MNGLDFNTFWNAYALKLDRKGAERAWKRLSQKDKKAALAGIDIYRGECHRRGVRMMYAQGYLNHRRWEDELEPSSQSAALSTKKNTDACQIPLFGDMPEEYKW